MVAAALSGRGDGRSPGESGASVPLAAADWAAIVYLIDWTEEPGAKTPDGKALVRGKRVTGFSNTEEEAAGLTDVVPFLVEDMLKTQGGSYAKAADWQPNVVIDGLLITGQNPASSAPAAQALLTSLHTHRTAQA